MARHPGAIDVFGMLEAISIRVPLSSSATISRKDAYEAIRKRFGVELTDSELAKRLDNLKRSGYIKIYKNDYRCSIELTKKAQLKKVEKDDCNTLHDGFYRFFCFDIPEDMSNERDIFRRKIKKAGAIQLQKSLWVCNHDISELIELVSKELGIEQYIICIISDKTDINETLNGIFSG